MAQLMGWRGGPRGAATGGPRSYATGAPRPVSGDTPPARDGWVRQDIASSVAGRMTRISVGTLSVLSVPSGIDVCAQRVLEAYHGCSAVLSGHTGNGLI